MSASDDAEEFTWTFRDGESIILQAIRGKEGTVIGFKTENADTLIKIYEEKRHKMLSF